MKPITCDHVGLFTLDADSSQRFYADKLGFKMKDDSMLDHDVVKAIFGLETDCRFIKMQKDGFVVELFEPLSAGVREKIKNIPRLNHWGYCVRDRTAFAKEQRTDGLPIIEIERNDHKVYFLTDPDGNKIEIRDYPK